MNKIAKNLINNAIATAENTANVVFPPLEKVNFPAVKTPIYLRNKNGDYVPVPTETGQAIVRTDNEICLGYMKKRYAIADNSELDNSVREGLEDSLPKHALQNIKLIEKTADNGSICRWGYSFDGLGRDIRQLTGSKTQLNFRVMIINSFGGQTAIRLQAGAEDLFCTNGCTSAELMATSFGHTASFNPAQVKPFIEKQVEYYELKVKTWQQWANKEINYDQAFQVLQDNYPASDSEIKRAEKKGFTAGEAKSRKTAQLMEQFEKEAEQRGSTVWSLYSALTYYASHSTGAFTVKNSANRDNVETTLIQREREVNNVTASESFLELAG
tara:strand:- start:79 stop:1062 length:984 start_codon:yes stop_codon:yes gene_type:complete